MLTHASCSNIQSILALCLLTSLLNEIITVQGSGKGSRDNFYYNPIDTGFVQELNNMRCVDHDGHVSGKYRWPFSCLLPASHLATGRLYDGTSSLPERVLAPPWLNMTLFKQGQKFARENSGNLLISHIYGLFCTNLFFDFKEVLLFWGGFDNPEKAALTYTRIANSIFDWYGSSPPDKDFLAFQEVAKNIRDVRNIHRNITKMADARVVEQRQVNLINPAVYKARSTNEKLWNAFKLDIAMSPIPLENRRFPIEYTLTEEERRPFNQFIQAITQFGFVGIPVLFPERVGLTKATNNELFAFNHLWAFYAYCLGIRDEYNISLTPDLYTTRKYFQDIFETFIQPAFFQVDFFTKVLIDPLLEGVNLLEVSMTPGIIVTRILRDLLRIPVPNTIQRLGSEEKISLAATDPIIGNNSNLNKLLVTTVSENRQSSVVFDVESAPPKNSTKST